MALTKSKKSKRKDTTVQSVKKADPMPKKGDKKPETEASSHEVNSLLTLFKSDELTELKKIMKIKDLTAVPVILAAVILGKLYIFKKLLKQKYDVNEAGPDKYTPLMWAVKNKNLEIIELLVSRTAEITPEDSSGDNIFQVALKSDLWDEKSFIDFWNTLKKTYPVTKKLYTNSKNKNSLLHGAVRRQWKLLADLLLKEKCMNVDVVNKRGVSALMMAAARNDEQLVDLLLTHGGDVFQEDERHCTPLCYAMANAMQKRLSPPFSTVDELTKHLDIVSGEKGIEHVYEQYLQRRLQLVVSPPENSSRSYHTVINKVTVLVVNFFMQHVQNGLQLLLQLHVFKTVCVALTQHADSAEYVLAILTLAAAVLDSNLSNMSAAVEAFVADGAADACLEARNLHEAVTPRVLQVLIFACGGTNSVSVLVNWLRDRRSALQPLYKKFMDACFQDNEDLLQSLEIQTRIDRFKSIIDEARQVENSTKKDEDQKPPDSADSNIQQKQPGQLASKSAKRVRRKARALKARIDRLRSADMVERRLGATAATSKEIIEIRLKTTATTSSSDSTVAQQVLEEDTVSTRPSDTSYRSVTSGTEDTCCEQPQNLIYLDENTSANRRAEFSCALTQLRMMLHDIVGRYETLWRNDELLGHPKFVGSRRGDDHPLSSITSREEQLARLQLVLPRLEQQCITKLVCTFDQSVQRLQQLFAVDDAACRLQLQQLRRVLLHHKVRGDQLLNSDINGEEDEEVEEPANVEPSPYGAIGEHLKRPTYMDLIENVLPTPVSDGYIKNSADDFTPDEIFLREYSTLSKTSSNLTREDEEKIKRKTEEHAYHLVRSVCRLCENESSSCEDLPSDSQSSSSTATTVTHQPLQEEKAIVKCEERETFHSSRWEALIRNLRSVLRDPGDGDVGGILRVCPNDFRSRFTIATGGNFGAVELAMDSFGRPVAMKRIRGHVRLLAAYMGSLLPIRHANILEYRASERCGDDLLFIATPLCELNLGEYLMCVKLAAGRSVPGPGEDALVTQFLAGLRHLHDVAGVIHGNLKPSNVLLDARGQLRLAEFGVTRALYRNVRAPHSSLIWFARETLSEYDRIGTVRCCKEADVQVAGMLLHFIVTRGLHPFGCVAEDIVRNIRRGTPRLQPPFINASSACEMHDLLSWMLVFERTGRPTVSQVLSHVYFWDTPRKWQLLLACSGLSSAGTPFPDLPLASLQASLEVRARQHRIRGDWQSLVRPRFSDFLQSIDQPELNSEENINDGTQDPDSPIGLLRFLRRCMLKRSIPVAELQSFFLGTFPALPLSLLRLLEHSEWLTHPAFAFMRQNFCTH